MVALGLPHLPRLWPAGHLLTVAFYLPRSRSPVSSLEQFYCVAESHDWRAQWPAEGA